MAGFLNKVMIIGNLGRDPEMRYTQGGQAVTNFTVATTRRWTSKDGGKGEETEWHRVVAWARLAEVCNEYLTKGGTVYIEGRIQTREYEDRDGVSKRSTEIVALDMQMLDRRPRSGGSGSSGESGGSGSSGEFGGGEPIEVDEMPF